MYLLLCVSLFCNLDKVSGCLDGPYLIELNSNFPAYIMNNTKDIIDMKKNIAKVISNNLFKPAINRESINLEEHGFIKL